MEYLKMYVYLMKFSIPSNIFLTMNNNVITLDIHQILQRKIGTRFENYKKNNISLGNR